MKLDADVMQRIDEAIGDVVTSDPEIVAKSTPKRRAL